MKDIMISTDINIIMFHLVSILLGLILLVCIVLRIYFALLRKQCNQYHTKANKSNSKSIAFFHPHCSAGGGGERVLWKAVQSLSEINDECGLISHIVIYTIDSWYPSYAQDVLKLVETRFSISIPPSVSLQFIHLAHCENDYYTNSNNIKQMKTQKLQRRSLITESLYTMKVAWIALRKFTPHIFFDTTGCAFTYLIAKIAGCQVCAYVHYPTISTDMLNLVWERRPMYNNQPNVSNSVLKTYFKLIYYTIFAIIYGLVGSLADVVMVNSTWTFNHISFLWRIAHYRRKISIVYPPVDILSLQELPLEGREKIIISIGQFRPEKDHVLQIRAFAKMMENHPEYLLLSESYNCQNNASKQNSRSDHQSDHGIKLVLIGSCRGEEDENRVKMLRDVVSTLGLSNHVEFVLNQPYSILSQWFRRASVGIHTMWNEHFGIGVVEMMAAGLITIAHNSAGPKMDIVVPLSTAEARMDPTQCKTGYLADSDESYALALHNSLRLDPNDEEYMTIRRNARKSAIRFSDEVFMESFKEIMMKFIL